MSLFNNFMIFDVNTSLVQSDSGDASHALLDVLLHQIIVNEHIF